MNIQAAPVEHYRWLCAKLNHSPAIDFRAIEAVAPDGSIRGMIGYEGWTPKSARVYLAMESPAVLRGLVGPGFRYPFIQCGLEVLTLSIPAYSARNIALAKRLGFLETYRIRDGWDIGIDQLLFEMRRGQCRWLEGAGIQRKAG